jgi:uncharacterized protein (TIGR03437 family)
VAADELVTAFGVDLATATVLNGNFPTTLGGTTLTLVDSSDTSYQAQLFFVSSGQVNYYVPSNVQPGPATITVQSGDSTLTTGIVYIQQVMPGLYTANANGQGAPAAIALIQHADGSPTTSLLTYSCSGSTCTPSALSPSSTDSLYIELFGTGIRHATSLASVTATVNGQSVPVQYAGAAPGYTGEDQVNIQVPSSLYQSGTVSLVVTADGQASNTVTLNLQ